MIRITYRQWDDELATGDLVGISIQDIHATVIRRRPGEADKVLFDGPLSAISTRVNQGG
jgi:hypothetical protein